MVLRIYVFKTICTSTGRTDSSFKMRRECTIKNESGGFYLHTMEGRDDMTSHINLSTWQGIYFCEHRNRASGRR